MDYKRKLRKYIFEVTDNIIGGCALIQQNESKKSNSIVIGYFLN